MKGPDGKELTRQGLVDLAFQEVLEDEEMMRRLVGAYSDHDGAFDRQYLTHTTVKWLKSLLPMSGVAAAKLEESERVLTSVFSGIDAFKMFLEMLGVARRDALGDDRASLELPMELRRLACPYWDRPKDERGQARDACLDFEERKKARQELGIQ